MMQLLKLVDYRRVLALLLVLLPVGGLWLWQSGWLFWWIAGLLVCSLASYGLHYWLARRGTRLLAEEAATRSDASWPPRAQGAWALVERMAEGVRPEDGPLGGEHLLMLGQNTLKAIAQYYHPQRKRPLLEPALKHERSRPEAGQGHRRKMLGKEAEMRPLDVRSGSATGMMSALERA
jgi:hypothetical protein